MAKRQLKLKLQQIAVYQKKSAYRKTCWYVNDDVLQKYSLTDLPVPNPLYKTASPSKPATQSPAAAATLSTLSGQLLVFTINNRLRESACRVRT